MRVQSVGTIFEKMDSPEPFAAGFGAFQMATITKADVQLSPPIDEWSNPSVEPSIIVNLSLSIGGKAVQNVIADFDPETRQLSANGTRVTFGNADVVSEKCSEVISNLLAEIDDQMD